MFKSVPIRFQNHPAVPRGGAVLGGSLTGYYYQVLFYAYQGMYESLPCLDKIGSECHLRQGVLVHGVSAHTCKERSTPALIIDYRCGLPTPITDTDTDYRFITRTLFVSRIMVILTYICLVRYFSLVLSRCVVGAHHTHMICLRKQEPPLTVIITVHSRGGHR